MSVDMSGEERGALVQKLSERFEQLVAMAGGPTKVARELGASRTTLDKWIKGDSRIPLEAAVRVASMAGKPLDWLLGEDAGVDPDLKLQPAGLPLMEGFVPVPMLQVQASAGKGRIVPGDVTLTGEIVALREDLLRQYGLMPGRTEALKAVGDSMEPTIRDGDILLVDRSIDNVVDNGIYVVVFGGAVLVKRVQVRRDNSVVLKSDNTHYDDEVVPAGEVADLIVEGRVRWCGRAM